MLKDLSIKEKIEILNLRDEKKSTKEISLKTGVSILDIYDVYIEYMSLIKRRIPYTINMIQHQLLLGGLLGDGRIKSNGKYGYYYSECHALAESEYCEWKFKMFNKLTEGHTMYSKNSNNKYSDAVEFCTVTTPQLLYYKELSIEDIIDQINEIGFLIYLLDDGWIRKDILQFCISGGILTKNQLELFCKKCTLMGIDNVHIIGKKRLDLAIPKENNKKIISIVKKIIPLNIDIIQKKFFFIFDENGNLKDEYKGIV